MFSWSTLAAANYLVLPTVVPEPSTYVPGGLEAGVMALIKANHNC